VSEISPTSDYRHVTAIGDMVEAFRQAARSLRRQPAFSGAVVAIVALGIGACTAMSSIIAAVFLDPPSLRRARTTGHHLRGRGDGD
jgi:putative ABC transport system permease protein